MLEKRFRYIQLSDPHGRTRVAVMNSTRHGLAFETVVLNCTKDSVPAGMLAVAFRGAERDTMFPIRQQTHLDSTLCPFVFHYFCVSLRYIVPTTPDFALELVPMINHPTNGIVSGYCRILFRPVHL